MKNTRPPPRPPGNPLQNAINPLDLRLQPIEYRSPADLKPYRNHARRHSAKQITKLAASINGFGFLTPVLVDETGTVMAGDARVLAAQMLGLSEIPVILITHLSAGQINAFRIADNRLGELATWDFNALAVEVLDIMTIDEVPVELTGWDMVEIDGMLDDHQPGNPGPDAADIIPPPPSVPVSQSGDIWLLGKNRLLCGSSLDPAAWERLMAGRKGAMSFTDPPYKVVIAGHVSGLGAVQHAEFAMASGEMNPEQFTQFNTQWLTMLAAMLDDGAILAVCMDWRHVFELISAARAAKLKMINMCVWNKSNGGMGSLYRSKHELVFILKKGSATHINNVKLGKHGRYRTNVWDYAGANSFGATRMDDLASHPTVKPVALVADAIRDVSHRGQVIIDAFIGSGTTILAAERTRRIAYGIEIEPGYVDVAIQRRENLTGQSVRLEGSAKTFAQVAARRAAAVAGPGDEPSAQPAAA